MPWFVLMTKPNHEAIVAVNLQRQGFSYYYPRFLLRKPGSSPTVRPLFPRYMFVTVEKVWRSLTGTRGVSYVLMGEGGPHLLPDSVIDSMKQREIDGLYQLVAPPKFKPGTKVKAKEGPLQGLPLIYEGMTGNERAMVLAEMLGRSVTVYIEEDILVAA